MDKLACMRAFCHVVKEGTFSAAAKKINSSKVLVSRHVAALEQDLGVCLLRRTTRKMSLTDEGKAYFERCLRLLDDFDELESSVKNRHQNVEGHLRISVPSEAFICLHLVPFISRFVKEYPNLTLDIFSSDRYIDIVEEGFDAAIRIGQLSDSSLIARWLADIEMIICSTPGYLAQNQSNLLDIPQHLEQHKLVVDTNYRGAPSWKFKREEEVISIQPKGIISVNSAQAVKQFLLEDIGVGLCPSFMVDDGLADGSLVRVLSDWEISSGGIYVVYTHRNHLSSKVVTFVNALAEYFS